MRLREIQTSELSKYDDFNRNNPNGHLLQSPAWANVKKNEWESHFLVIEEGEEIVGCLSAMIRSIPYIKKKILYIPRGPIFKDYDNTKLWEQFTQDIKEYAKEKNCVLVKIDPAIEEGQGVEEVLKGLGYVNLKEEEGFGGMQPAATMRLDITPEPDDLLGGMPKKTRYNITYPEKKGVVYKKTNLDGLDDFSKVMEATSSRANFLSRQKNYYKLLLDSLGEDACLIIAYYEDIPIAGGITLVYGDKAWAMYGGAANVHTNLKAYYGLNYQRMLWAKTRGAKLFDFFGIPIKREPGEKLYGLYQFKKSFGGRDYDFIGEHDLVVNRLFYFIWQGAKQGHKLIKKIKLFKKKE
ncbi:peptidoglycan bridge formation glycyltransferase FemA/FemB family protein [Alkalicella caledoniensis]|uniref:Peptidoglycan bridge formation glycyltransferase FemA/FemB family protein n=1 Tax=Alkalicella caledoniensis TaxID=2731377 RepID=A0A7G9WBS1_ALKCA|nr:peptidoglycan bridge formation glycyltransferase FemA/FemB family protein [Alkalicella caledoniensis]QNO16133.1 peptidoglycan bridge formation glycyltransferase FemA/FemB family protein [Alkalicella caledoniensis]